MEFESPKQTLSRDACAVSLQPHLAGQTTDRDEAGLGCFNESIVAGSESDQHDVGDANRNPKVCPVTDELAHPSTHARYQEIILQGRSFAFGSLGDFSKGSLIQTNNASNVFFKVHSIPLCRSADDRVNIGLPAVRGLQKLCCSSVTERLCYCSVTVRMREHLCWVSSADMLRAVPARNLELTSESMKNACAKPDRN